MGIEGRIHTYGTDVVVRVHHVTFSFRLCAVYQYDYERGRKGVGVWIRDRSVRMHARANEHGSRSRWGVRGSLFAV